MHTWIMKRGFGPGRVKEYFIADTDGDTLGRVVAGPFESEAQAGVAVGAILPLIGIRQLVVIYGHLATAD